MLTFLNLVFLNLCSLFFSLLILIAIINIKNYVPFDNLTLTCFVSIIGIFIIALIISEILKEIKQKRIRINLYLSLIIISYIVLLLHFFTNLKNQTINILLFEIIFSLVLFLISSFWLDKFVKVAITHNSIYGRIQTLLSILLLIVLSLFINDIRPFDYSFVVFFIVIMLIYAVIINCIVLIAFIKNKKTAKRDKEEMELKIYNESIGQVYLTTREKNELKKMYLVTFDKAKYLKTCPICKSELECKESKTTRNIGVTKRLINGLYVSKDRYSNEVEQAYEMIPQQKELLVISIKCPKCGYEISYIDGVGTETKEVYNSKEEITEEVTYNVRKTERNANWGKFSEIMNKKK